MEDYQIFIITFSSMTVIFLCCALPSLSKICLHSSSVTPLMETYIKNNKTKFINSINNIKKSKNVPEEQINIYV